MKTPIHSDDCPCEAIIIGRCSWFWLTLGMLMRVFVINNVWVWELISIAFICTGVYHLLAELRVHFCSSTQHNE